MSNRNTGGPAFPLPSHTKRWDDAKKEYQQDEGMTLRDYFAAKAMAADMIAGVHENDFAWSAARSYKMADAMLKAREA